MSIKSQEEEITRFDDPRLGLFIRGYVSGRTKKYFETANKWRITYSINCANGRKTVYSWDDQTLLSVGTIIEIPVYVSSYCDKNGTIRTQLTYDIGKKSDEEEF